MTQRRFQGGPLPLLLVGLQKQVAFWGLAALHLGGWLSNSGNGTGPFGTVQDFAPKQRSVVVKIGGKKVRKRLHVLISVLYTNLTKL